MSNGKIFVTGSSGFVGSNLIKNLQRKNFSVVGLDCRPPKFFAPNQFVQADVRDESILRKILKVCKPTAIFHLAAVSTIQLGQFDPRETWSVNFGGTCALVDAVKSTGLRGTKIFFASTDKVYGAMSGDDGYTEDLPLKPLTVSPYDCSKAAADDFVQTCDNAVSLRFCNLYGPCDVNMSRIVPATIDALINGRPPTLNRCADSAGVVHDFYRDMLYIDDLCAALTDLVDKDDLAEKIFNFGVGSPIAMNDLIFLIMRLTNIERPPTIKIVPTEIELARQSMNFERAQRLLNFRPKTSLVDGLRQTIDWWKNFYGGDTNEQCS